VSTLRAGGSRAARRCRDEGIGDQKVDLDRIDRLVNMAGELAIAQAMIGEQASRLGG
jgi:chemotaxis protein histidine kinase CheA